MSARVDSAASPVATRGRPCPVCDVANEDVEPLPYGRDGWEIVACRGCGFPHLLIVPETKALIETLAWETQYADGMLRSDSGSVSEAMRTISPSAAMSRTVFTARRGWPGLYNEIGYLACFYN